MSEARKYPSWYWPKGLHDAKILEASMRDDALVLRIDSGNAMYDNFVEQIVFLDARLKTPLPAPTKRKPVYWIWDELTELPFTDTANYTYTGSGFLYFQEGKLYYMDIADGRKDTSYKINTD